MPTNGGSNRERSAGRERRVTKKLFIKTYGCQMNVYDSARMADVLAPLGYEQADSAAAADLVLLNTCHIREKASEKVFSELGRLARAKRERAAEGRTLMVGVAGCVAQAEGAEILRRAPVVDVVVGPQAYHRLADMIAAAEAGGPARGKGVAPNAARLDTDFPAESKFAALPAESAARGPAAFLTIQEGCDKFCSFCVVPYTRGAEFSRPPADIEEEARRLVGLGARELTLLGQNVNAYRGAGADGPVGLGALIARLARLAGLARLRYTTSHPGDVAADQIAAHRDVAALMPHLHLPVQSGSDRVLAAMNRRHTADEYRETVARVRRARPDIALSSDFIVGFPGETDADFEATLALVREIGFAQAYSFKYSPRPGTPAADKSERVEEAAKAERLRRLQDLLVEQQLAYNRGFVGGTVEVLLDRRGAHPGQLIGRSPYMQAVHVAAPAELFGTVVPVHVLSAHANSLAGALVDNGAKRVNQRVEPSAARSDLARTDKTMGGYTG